MENITANRLAAGPVLRFAYLAHLALVFPVSLLFVAACNDGRPGARL